MAEDKNKSSEKEKPVQQPQHDQPAEGGKTQIEEATRIQSHDLPSSSR